MARRRRPGPRPDGGQQLGDRGPHPGALPVQDGQRVAHRVLLLTGLLENVGYRQLHAWFRLRGLVAALMRRTPVWTAMPRTGFTEAEPVGVC